MQKPVTIMDLDPRIGVLNSGKYYCFPHGNGKPELVGSIEEVEVALGLRPASQAPIALTLTPSNNRLWNVTLKFQYPSWDEVGGIEYQDIVASGKAEANSIVRRRASNDGHLAGGKGRATFTAIEQDVSV
jgi:hypothetical protein